MIYLSPMGPGAFLFFQTYKPESAKEEIIEFDLSVSKELNIELGVSMEKQNELSISKLVEL